jgi:hypothetical protein
LVVLLAASGFLWRDSQGRAPAAMESERSEVGAGSARRRAGSVSYPAVVAPAISPGRERYTAEVPFPAAAERHRWRYSLWGEVMLAIYKLWGEHPRVDPGLMHVAENRHADWAPVMEDLLQDRFSADIAVSAGVTGLEAHRIDCRTSSCRIQLEYPTSLDQVYVVPHERPADDGVWLGGRSLPLEHFLRMTGPLGAITQIYGAPGEGTADPRLVDVVVFFSAEEIDPNRYAAWVAWRAAHHGSAQDLAGP